MRPDDFTFRHAQVNAVERDDPAGRLTHQAQGMARLPEPEEYAARLSAR